MVNGNLTNSEKLKLALLFPTSVGAAGLIWIWIFLGIGEALRIYCATDIPCQDGNTYLIFGITSLLYLITWLLLAWISMPALRKAVGLEV